MTSHSHLSPKKSYGNLLVPVAFIDPGNLDGDLQAGAVSGYSLWLLLWSTAMGLLIQLFSGRIGVVTDRHIAEICRDEYPYWAILLLWFMAEIALIAADIQEVIGSTIAIKILSNGLVPHWAGVLITASDCVNRLRIQEILLGLTDLKTESQHKIRGAYYLKVNNFKDLELKERMQEAKLSVPCIVKPQVACGVSEAHSMAIVLEADDFTGLSVSLPAVVQEYVDHSSNLFKFYVLGENVFHAVKNSTPNADVLKNLYEKNGFKPLLFDSLKSLPISENKKASEIGDCSNLDIGLVTDAANYL